MRSSSIASTPRWPGSTATRRPAAARRRIAVYARGAAPSSVADRGEPTRCSRKVRSARPRDRPAARRLAARRALPRRCSRRRSRERDALGVGESFVTPQGTSSARRSISFFAPDSELHGVLARQRELAELAHAVGGARAGRERGARRAGRRRGGARRRAAATTTRKASAFASQQRRCHDLELELMQLKQAAEAAEKRRAQIAAGARRRRRAGRRRAGRRRRRLRRELADAQSRLHDETASAMRPGTRATRPRSRSRAAASGCASPSARRRRRCSPSAAAASGWPSSTAGATLLAAQIAQQRGLLDAADVRAGGDRLDAGRGGAAAPARRPRRGRAGARRGARPAGGARRRVARGRGSAARRRAEARAGAREDRGHAPQGAGGRAAGAAVRRAARRGAADLAALPEQLKAFGNKSGLPAEIERLQQAIAELGAVNLAALDELAGRDRAQGLPRRAGRRPHRGDGDARERHPPDRPRIAAAAAADLRRRQRELLAAVPGAVRRRAGAACC